MARVRLLSATEGHRAGEVIDLPGEDASLLVDGGRAEFVRSDPFETPEGA